MGGLILQLVRGLANVLGVDHVAPELARRVDLACHGLAEADVDNVYFPMLLKIYPTMQKLTV